MKLIAHRGLAGLDPCYQEDENHPSQIERAIKAGFDVEIDLRYDEGRMYLGHDTAEYEVQDHTLADWAKNCTMYAHCKDMEAAFHCPRLDGIIPFCHSNDDFVLLKDGHLWVHPSVINEIPPTIRPQCIIVLPRNMESPRFTDYYGVCADNVFKLKGY